MGKKEVIDFPLEVGVGRSGSGDRPRRGEWVRKAEEAMKEGDDWRKKVLGRFVFGNRATTISDEAEGSDDENEILTWPKE